MPRLTAKANRLWPRIITPVSPTRIAKGSTNGAAGKGVWESAVAAGAAVASRS